MTNQPASSEKGGKQRSNLSPARVLWIILGLTGICLLCLISLYYAEVHPRYIPLPIPPPEDENGQDDWWSTTYSVQLYGERDFLVSRFAYITNSSASRQSWASIVAYFDEKLDRLGWVRSEIWAPCNIYLPEGRFLQEGENGYVHYFRKGYEDRVTYGSEYSGDTICLAVWPESINADGSPAGFYIDLLSARSSILSRFMDVFSD